MKVTKKQIENAFFEWNKELRVEPSKFKTEEQMVKLDARVVAKEQAEELFKLIKK